MTDPYQNKQIKWSGFTERAFTSSSKFLHLTSGANSLTSWQDMLDDIASVYGSSLRTYATQDAMVADDIKLGEYAIVEENNYSFYKITSDAVSGLNVALTSGLTATFQSEIKPDSLIYECQYTTDCESIDLTQVNGFQSAWYDSNKAINSSAKWLKTGTNTPARAGDGVYTDGYFYDSVGNQFEVSGDVYVEKFGAVPNTESSTAFSSALSYVSSSSRGGIVRYMHGKLYRIGSTGLSILENTTLTCSQISNDQDETKAIAYDDFLGGVLLLGSSATIELTGDGSAFVGGAILSSALDGYTIPTTDQEATDLVATFTGTGITIQGTGTKINDVMILGFNTAILDSGNRAYIDRVRFDCLSGIILGGGSDVTRVSRCHGWPYVTGEIPGLTPVKDYRSGTSFKIQNNSDTYSLIDCYSYGYEKGYHLIGASGQVVSAIQLERCRADSGNIGGSNTSIGFDIGDYCANISLGDCQSSNYDHLGVVDTRGADIGGGERLNNVTVTGGVWNEPDIAFWKIDNGYVEFANGMFTKEGDSTAVFDWNTTDGGLIMGCRFEEMYSGSSDGLIFDPVSDAADIAVQRIGNSQKSNIHADNRMKDNVFRADQQRLGPEVNLTIDGGEITVPSGVSRIVIDTESSASTDDLNTINGCVDGQVLYCRAASSSRTVVFKHATGNILCGSDKSADNAADLMTLLFNTAISSGTCVMQSFESNGG